MTHHPQDLNQMELDTLTASVLGRPNIFLLPGNRSYVQDFVGSGGSVRKQPSGHLVFYGTTGRRILLTDPEGHPLHECEWTHDAQGQDRFVSARLQLDWGQWIGIKPGQLTYETHLNLSARPGWEAITKDDLRNMAARAMNMSLEHIRFFYRDDDITIDASGQATISQRKDAFYILQDGRFDQTQFMSCMTAMHWERIDYLPVVELFLSLLPGTGSATFEFIRGLYDDQNPRHRLPLHYRGIPPYPSEGAFRLFSQFFTPSAPEGIDPLRLFLDPSQAGRVTWTPSPHPPLRYIDSGNTLGVTVSQGKVVKATQSTDSTGLSYFSPKPRGLPPCGRSVTTSDGNLIFQDEAQHFSVPVHDTWGISDSSQPQDYPATIPSWRSLFPQGTPHITASEAYSAVLLYPEGNQVIGEQESQPFLFDYVDDLQEENPQLRMSIQSAHRILINGCEAALGACLQVDASKTSTVLYRWEALAQKQAQTLWNQCARTQRWDAFSTIQFLPQSQVQETPDSTYDLIYQWTPFDQFRQPARLEQTFMTSINRLTTGGTLIVSGLPQFEAYARKLRISVAYAEYVHQLPTFRLHQAILPKATLYQDLMVFIFLK
ncbi:MAG: hypothetical protein NPIRA02_10640 [Nitrospirales bacterium]|nr:MAG: hypothetical protein NPIRA02_10640 [Nitrospirales bacterium]